MVDAQQFFLKRAIITNGVPDEIAIAKSDASLAGLQAVNVMFKFTGEAHHLSPADRIPKQYLHESPLMRQKDRRTHDDVQGTRLSRCNAR